MSQYLLNTNKVLILNTISSFSGRVLKMIFGRKVKVLLCHRQPTLWQQLRITGLVLLAVLIGVFALLVFLGPVLFYFSPSLQDYLIFRGSPDFSTELAAPELLNLKNARAFYITTDEGIKLGTWHILPSAAPNPTSPESIGSRSARFEDELRKDGSVAVIYFHGNTPSRAQAHRVDLYRILADLGCHVIAFDYRSFADSSIAPLSETALVKDGMFVYDYILERVGPGTAIILWGHSLGSGIAASVAAALCGRGSSSDMQHCADGLVLHAGFTDLLSAIQDNSLAVVMNWVPWFTPLVRSTLEQRDLMFNTTANVVRVSGPLLVLHAQDDDILPVTHGRALRVAASGRGGDSDAAGGASGVTYIEFSGDFGYSHNGIVEAPELRQIAGEYIQLCREFHSLVQDMYRSGASLVHRSRLIAALHAHALPLR
ncbi:lysophosphatidylserine lipase ABHD12 isoform X2 [Hyalella azteca]|uniref:Lysophosphatidylserine lipase ABHD12 isoform X2 n=1 Tax=Hyalella azteca TaxID=294128 RepID=A0A8B7NFP5_HYAAZ|nr:lysophosphatidylserine lipase ABHD12 isoform X2 [Hyalella azteca]